MTDQPGLGEDAGIFLGMVAGVRIYRLSPHERCRGTLVFDGHAWPMRMEDQTKLIILLRSCSDLCMCILNIVSAVLVKPCLEKKQDKSLKRVRGEGGMKQLLCKEG